MSNKVIEPTVFELSREGVCGVNLPEIDVPGDEYEIPEKMIRKGDIGLPQMAEIDVMRHFVKLSYMNHHVEKGFYPLGSCTMKYNPKINENCASLSGFAELHPLIPGSMAEGALEVMAELQEMLMEISGHSACTLQPAAGAHGEFTGLLTIRAYHQSNGNPRKEVILPDSAHGTNPASIIFSGYKPIQIESGEDGMVDLKALKKALSKDTAAVMLTNPNTLGLFERNIKEIAKLTHEVGAQLYMDGANLNALMGIVRPGDLGFDVTHFNLHKTFSTPHGGGGPGAGPITVADHLSEFLPVPVVVRDEEGGPYLDWKRNNSIGKVCGFWGNFLVIVKAWVYLRMLGGKGVREVSEWAILNANYLLSMLKDEYNLKYKETPMHEFVIDSTNIKNDGVTNIDIAKRLLDYGYHAPTMSFPLIVHQALMIEPTETESIKILNKFAMTMNTIAKEAKENPEKLHEAPVETPIGRLDEAKAARIQILRWPIPDSI